jgi:hypothetical protein
MANQLQPFVRYTASVLMAIGGITPVLIFAPSALANKTEQVQTESFPAPSRHTRLRKQNSDSGTCASELINRMGGGSLELRISDASATSLSSSSSRLTGSGIYRRDRSSNTRGFRFSCVVSTPENRVSSLSYTLTGSIVGDGAFDSDASDNDDSTSYSDRDTSNWNTPQWNTPQWNVPRQSVPSQNVTHQNVPSQNVPRQYAPRQNVSHDDVPYWNAPPQDVPHQNVPYWNAPPQEAPPQDVPRRDRPNRSTMTLPSSRSVEIR